LISTHRSYDWACAALFDLALKRSGYLAFASAVAISREKTVLGSAIRSQWYRKRRSANAPTNTRCNYHTGHINAVRLGLYKCLCLGSVAASLPSVFVRSHATLQRRRTRRTKQASIQGQTRAKTDTGGTTRKSPIGYDISAFLTHQRFFRFAGVHSGRTVLSHRQLASSPRDAGALTGNWAALASSDWRSSHQVCR
jgi:hypothetical protein